MKQTNQVKTKEVEVSVEQFLKLPAYRGQLMEGMTLLNERHLKILAESSCVEALHSITNPIVLNGESVEKSVIISGNHRREWAEREVAVGRLSKEVRFIVRLIVSPLTLEEQSMEAMNSNSTARVNGRAHAIHGEFDITRKIFRPIYDAICMTKQSTCFTEARKEHLAMLLGALLNNNRILFENLKQDNALDISGAQLYQAKNFSEANKDVFFRVRPLYDLRGLESSLAKLLWAGINIINELRVLGKWQDVLGNNRTLEYIFLAASLRGDISSTGNSVNMITLKKTKTVFSKGGLINQLQELTKEKFVNDPPHTEPKILNLLTKTSKNNL